jgi:hypothetical protein
MIILIIFNILALVVIDMFALSAIDVCEKHKIPFVIFHHTVLGINVTTNISHFFFYVLTKKDFLIMKCRQVFQIGH